jgi:putative transposase
LHIDQLKVFEDDRRTIVLPTIGAVSSKENTRRVQRRLAKNNARLLNLSERWGGCSSLANSQ